MTQTTAKTVSPNKPAADEEKKAAERAERIEKLKKDNAEKLAQKQATDAASAPPLNSPGAATDSVDPPALPDVPPVIEQAAEPEIIKYKAMKPFTAYLNGMPVTFREGEVIQDQMSAALLLEKKCPIAPLNDPKWQHCPSCNFRYPTEG